MLGILLGYARVPLTLRGVTDARLYRETPGQGRGQGLALCTGTSGKPGPATMEI